MKGLCSCLFFRILGIKYLPNEEIQRLPEILSVLEPVVHLFLLYLCFFFFPRDLGVLSALNTANKGNVEFRPWRDL